MQVTDFYRQSGFKVLALAKLSESQYSIILYILNTAVSGLDHIITNATELSEMIDFSEQNTLDSLYELSDMNIIKIRFSEKTTTSQLNPSMRLTLNFNTKQWSVGPRTELTRDAIIFPFKRGNLVMVEPNLNDANQKNISEQTEATWRRVHNLFVCNRTLDENEISAAESSAKVLVDTHPVDQILLLIKYFGKRIPTLSLLASSWSHYQETYIEEHHNIDLLGARKKHSDLDERLRNSVVDILNSKDQIDFDEEELQVLEILKKHRHPRRQLFWAFQARSKYPNLSKFFEKNLDLMLAVTSSGSPFKK